MFITWSQLLLQAINLKSYEDGGPSFQTTVFLRSHNCEVLCEYSKCTFCEGAEKSLLKNTKATKGKEPAQPVGSKSPLTLTSKERLVATVQQQREIVKELEGRTSELEVEIEKNSITVNESLEKGLLKIYLQITILIYLHILKSFGSNRGNALLAQNLEEDITRM